MRDHRGYETWKLAMLNVTLQKSYSPPQLSAGLPEHVKLQNSVQMAVFEAEFAIMFPIQQVDEPSKLNIEYDLAAALPAQTDEPIEVVTMLETNILVDPTLSV